MNGHDWIALKITKDLNTIINSIYLWRSLSLSEYTNKCY